MVVWVTDCSPALSSRPTSLAVCHRAQTLARDRCAAFREVVFQSPGLALKLREGEEEGWERGTQAGQTAGGLGVAPAVWICGL